MGPHRRQPLCHPKGVTLIEIIVVITLIAVIAGWILVAWGTVPETAQIEATKALITKIDQALSTALDEFNRESAHPIASDVADAGTDADRNARSSVIARKRLFRERFPQNLASAIAARNAGRISFPDANVYDSSKNVAATEPAECLYWIVTAARRRGGTQANLDFRASEVADTDGDGLKEFVDAWGNPLVWVREPMVEFDRVTTNTPSGNPEPDPYDPANLLTGAASSQWAKYRSNRDSGNTRSRHFCPVIVSAGPDGQVGVQWYCTNSAHTVAQDTPGRCSDCGRDLTLDMTGHADVSQVADNITNIDMDRLGHDF